MFALGRLRSSMGRFRLIFITAVILTALLVVSFSIRFQRGMESQLKTLESEFDDYKRNFNGNYSEFEILNESFKLYRDNHHYNDSEYYKQLYQFYYSKVDHKTGEQNLKKELKGLHWKASLTLHEKLGYLEWFLENKGWHTLFIIASAVPKGSNQIEGSVSFLKTEIGENSYCNITSEPWIFNKTEEIGLDKVTNMRVIENIQGLSGSIIVSENPMRSENFDFTDFEWWNNIDSPPLTLADITIKPAQKPASLNAMWLDPGEIVYDGPEAVGLKFNLTVLLDISVPINSWQFYLTYNNSLLNVTRCAMSGNGKSLWSRDLPVFTAGPAFGKQNYTLSYVCMGEVLRGSVESNSKNELAWVEFETVKPPNRGETLTSEIRLDVAGIVSSKAVRSNLTPVTLGYGKAIYRNIAVF